MAKEKKYQLCQLKGCFSQDRISTWTYKTGDLEAYVEARDKGELGLPVGTVLLIGKRFPKYNEYECQLWQESLWPASIRGSIFVKMDEVELTEKVTEGQAGTHWNPFIRRVAIRAKLRRMLKEGPVIAEERDPENGQVITKTYVPGQEIQQTLDVYDYNCLRLLTEEELLTHNSESLRLQTANLSAFYVQKIQEGFDRRIANVGQGLAQLQRLSEDLRGVKGFIPGHLKRRDNDLYKLIRQRFAEYTQDCDLAQAYQEILNKIEGYREALAEVVTQIFEEQSK